MIETSKFKQRDNKGASLVEMAIALPIILLILVAGIDLARISWIKSSVQHTVDITLERAKGDERLAPLNWNAVASSSNYHQAIQELNTYFNSNTDALAQLKTGISYEGITIPGIDEKQQLALLIPGASVVVDNHGTETNSFVSSVDQSTIPPRAVLRQFPIEVKTYAKIDTLLFGAKTYEITAAGYIPILSNAVVSPFCGDGVRDVTSEDCDPNADNSSLGDLCSCTQACDISCQPGCGNNIVEANEACDGSTPAGWPVGCSCTASCQQECAPPPAFCGDGILNQNSETCEPPNTIGTGAAGSCPVNQTCSSICNCIGTPPPSTSSTVTSTTLPPPSCGNGIVEAYEECDGAIGCNMGQGERCVSCQCQSDPSTTTTTTIPPSCGNGIIDPGEECDGTSLPPGCEGNACVCTGCALNCPPGNCVNNIYGSFAADGSPVMTTHWGPDPNCCPLVGSSGPKAYQDTYYPDELAAYVDVPLSSACPHNDGGRLGTHRLDGCSAYPCYPSTGCRGREGIETPTHRGYGCYSYQDCNGRTSYWFAGCTCLCPNDSTAWLPPSITFNNQTNSWEYFNGACPEGDPDFGLGC